MSSKIRLYLMQHFRNEFLAEKKRGEELIREIKRRDEQIKVLENGLKNWHFVRVKLQELYWTVTRFMGLAHLHDGSRQKKTPTRKYNVYRSEPIKVAFKPEGLDVPIPPDIGHGRILLDMTPAARSGLATGIQRVVKNIAREAVKLGGVIPLIIDDGNLVSYYRHPNLPCRVEVGHGDKFIMLDSGWDIVDEYLPFMEEIKKSGGQNISCVYDLIPIRHPYFCVDGLVQHFERWLSIAALRSDAIIAISKSVAEDVAAYANAHNIRLNREFKIGWWTLGADFTPSQGDVSQHARDATTSKFFLSVGTIEPRKGYAVALDAFDSLWDQGCDARFVIVGRPGWHTDALIERIKKHSEFGKRLFWFNNAGDADLQFLYERAHALIMPSIAEGFGLPIVEAAHYGVPVIASDIPVFREVGNGSITYFETANCEALSNKILQSLTYKSRPSAIKPVSWEESAKQLIDMVRSGSYQIRL